ncbi:MAG: heparan-alpha-glucosaminide N-acetyltransferase domain-containing protein [Oscillospiraceae bacterium]
MSENRLLFLDAWRGLALYLMLLYHLLFDFYMFGWMGWEQIMSWPLVLLEKFIAYSFILCAGISATLTRSNWKRGLVTLGAAALVTIASFIVDAPIRFGVLQFLGMAMLIYAAVGKWVQRVPAKIAPFLWLALFIGTHILTDRVFVNVRWLFWLGFRYPGYISYDHFPILPYIFLFFLGSWAGGRIQKNRDRFLSLNRYAPKWLTVPGRRTLIIYLLHQPVLYGICLLVYNLA